MDNLLTGLEKQFRVTDHLLSVHFMHSVSGSDMRVHHAVIYGGVLLLRGHFLPGRAVLGFYFLPLLHYLVCHGVYGGKVLEFLLLHPVGVEARHSSGGHLWLLPAVVLWGNRKLVQGGDISPMCVLMAPPTGGLLILQLHNKNKKTKNNVKVGPLKIVQCKGWAFIVHFSKLRDTFQTIWCGWQCIIYYNMTNLGCKCQLFLYWSETKIFQMYPTPCSVFKKVFPSVICIRGNTSVLLLF